ncbi:transporter substrate-binding domain-containing protein [Hydrogenophaga sp. BPS33]|nr:transporter substrate-binding domain-containing protein [Hydrogenophaga sp. BPS33]
MLAPEAVRLAFAPQGRLCASINAGNAVLARRDPHGPGGVSVDLARAFAAELGAELDTIVFDGAAKSVQALREERADIGFFAIDPARSEGIRFTPPYVLIEGSYLVRDGDARVSGDEVDRAGTHVVVAQGSAYDLFLTRELRHATLVRTATSQVVVDTMLADGHPVAAGVRQQLEQDAARLGGVRLLPGSFMVIRQAMGCPQSKGDAAAAYLSDFVERMKATGFVREALKRNGIEGASVAP